MAPREHPAAAVWRPDGRVHGLITGRTLLDTSSRVRRELAALAGGFARLAVMAVLFGPVREVGAAVLAVYVVHV